MNGGADHSALMFAARITLPHLSVSLEMNLPNSAGVIDIGTAPKSASRAFILGSARAALISLLSLSMISVGVFLGAPIPYQPLASSPEINSAMGGMSGSAAERVAEVTARARNLPVRMYSIK